MAEDRFMMISMDDERLKHIAEVLGNKTCKKIMDYLTENKEASQQDLATNLKIPINTVEYNIKKLVKADLVQKRKNFFWSSRGKKIVMYELSNKSIVISPRNSNLKSKFKSIVPGFLIVGALTFATWTYEQIKYSTSRAASFAMNDGTLEATGAKLASAPQDTIPILTQAPTPIWAWFLAGGLIALAIVSIINWRKL